MTEINLDRAETSKFPEARALGARPEERDDRFRRLLGDAAWHTLPAVVRARFSRHLAPGEIRTFTGEVVEMRLSRIGCWLARASRLVGSPLPDRDGALGPATVTVREDPGLGGQIWTRTYSRPGALPQTINSVKRFQGATGLEEYLGFGLVMPLDLQVTDGTLVFRSAGYAFAVGRRRIRLPAWLSPGVCTIVHRVLGAEVFSFTLTLDHPRAGRLLKQVAVFHELGA